MIIWQLFQIPQRYRFSSKSQQERAGRFFFCVVLDTTKVQIFKQITTSVEQVCDAKRLFQIPQRYRFSSKSQHLILCAVLYLRCFRYHKGTDFQANHNIGLLLKNRLYVVLDTTKVQIFKQITTNRNLYTLNTCCFRYHKGTDFQANHNLRSSKVSVTLLFQIPQRYRFSSKSQQYKRNILNGDSCFRYHKGTDFQANHNFHQ